MGNLCAKPPDSAAAIMSDSNVAACTRSFCKRSQAAALQEVQASRKDPDHKFNKQYKIVRTLGAGSFAKVYLAQSRATGQTYAAKFIAKNKFDTITDKEGFVRNVSIVRSLQGHPSMVRLHAVYEEDEHWVLVLEQLAGGPLFDQVVAKGHYGEREAALVMHQLLAFLAHCHARHICHRDLKPENLLLASADDERSLRVIDWGTAAYCFPGQKLKERIGTSYYIAPEVLRKSYDCSADIWSAGVILYILLCGHPPFGGRNDEQVLEKVRTGVYDFAGEDWDAVTPEAKDLIQHMLVMDPAGRSSAQQLLEHPWFTVAQSAAPASLGVRMVSRLRNFVRLNRLKRLALVVLARTLGDSDVQRIRKSFAGHASEDGKVDFGGLERALTGLGLEVARDDMRQVFTAADTQGSGAICSDEFIAAIVVSNRFCQSSKYSANTEPERLVRQSFDALDHDKDGVISPEDLLWVLPQGASLAEAIGLLEEVDPGGRVGYREFAQMMEPQGLLQMMSMHTMMTGVPLPHIASVSALNALDATGEQVEQQQPAGDCSESDTPTTAAGPRAVHSAVSMSTHDNEFHGTRL